MATVTLKVPAKRGDCAAWLQEQSPEVVADVLEATEVLFTTVSAMTQQTPADIVRAHTQEVQRLRGTHAEEMQRVVAELTPSIREQCHMETTRTVDDLKERHASEVSLLEAQVRERQADLERTKNVMEEMHTRACADMAQERDHYREELDRAKGVLATNDADGARRMEERTAVLRAEFERDLAGKELLYQKNEINLQKLMEEMRQNAEARAERDGVQYETRIRTLEESMCRKDDELREVHTTTVARVETLFNSLVGNSSRKGEVGETFVKAVFGELQLGTLTHVGKIRCAGFADYQWEHNTTQGSNAPPLRAIVEIKFSLTGNSNRDVAKFHEDVREAAHTGRATAAIFLSLVDRVEGRPKISIELVHGVPVLWAGRNVDDDISARSLTEMAFTILAHVWPQLCAAPDEDVALREASAYVAQTIVAFEKMDTHLKAIEKANETIRTNTAQVRTARDRVLSTAYQFRARHDPLPAADHTAIRAEIADKMREYYTKNKRYPRSLQDIHMDAGDHADVAQTLLQQVADGMRTEKYRQGQRKRRAVDDANDDAVGGGGGGGGVH